VHQEKIGRFPYFFIRPIFPRWNLRPDAFRSERPCSQNSWQTSSKIFQESTSEHTIGFKNTGLHTKSLEAAKRPLARPPKKNPQQSEPSGVYDLLSEALRVKPRFLPALVSSRPRSPADRGSNRRPSAPSHRPQPHSGGRYPSAKVSGGGLDLWIFQNASRTE